MYFEYKPPFFHRRTKDAAASIQENTVFCHSEADRSDTNTVLNKLSKCAVFITPMVFGVLSFETVEILPYGSSSSIFYIDLSSARY